MSSSLSGCLRKFLFACLALCAISSVSAQDRLLPVFHFNQLTTADGLPTNEIRSTIVRDRKGFIWIPTIEGLARYDGYSCKVYRNRPDDSTSISSNHLTAVHLDKKDRLWLGSWECGLSMYDPVTEKFINFLPRPGDSTWLQTKLIWYIREDRAGNLWIPGGDGEITSVNVSALLADTDADSIRRHIRFRTYRPGTPGNKIWDVAGWTESTVLVSTFEEGFFVIEPSSGSISRPDYFLPNGAKLDTLNKVTFFHETDSVQWMLTQEHSLIRIDESHNAVKYYPRMPREYHQSRHELIYTVEMGGDGRVWIGTSAGFELFDPRTEMFCDYLCSSGDPTNEGVEPKISRDNSGTIWIASGSSGVYFLDRRSMRIPHYGLRDTARSPLTMMTIEPSKDGSAWIGAKGKVFNIDPLTSKVIGVVDLLKGEKSFVYPGESDSYSDGRGNIWYGTYGLGLYKLELATRRVTNYRASSQLPPLVKNICWSVTGGNNDSLWIAGNVDGLLQFDSRTNRFSRPTDSLLLNCRNVSHVMKDDQGRVWVSDERKGLIVVDASGKAVAHFEHNWTDSSSLAFSKVRGTYQDLKGRIWIGGGSLELWEPTTRSLKHFSNEQFGPTTLVEPVGSDSRERVWISFSWKGLRILDPITGRHTEYDHTEGLCAQVLHMLLLPDGRVLVTGWSGVNIIDPDMLAMPHTVPPLVISRATVNDSTNVSVYNLNRSAILDLPYTQNVLEFEFAVIDPGATHLIAYSYKLEGLESAWINPEDRRYVRYSGLSPGRYTFRVKAVNRFGKWPDQEIAVAIAIAPPWWRAWWAYATYGVLLVGLLFGGYRLRLRQIYLKQQADMEHFQAERLAEVDRLKSRFFANISHEFRTPLTLILGPVEQAIDTVEDLSLKQKLNLVKDNAKKLYALVNQLLDFSRVESGTMKLAVSRGDLIGFLRRTVMSFESWAEREKIDLRFVPDVESAEGFFDSEKLEKIMNNLLSNALKFTPEGGTVEVSLRIPMKSGRSNLKTPDEEGASSLRNTPRNERVCGDLLEVLIKDTGPGIPPEHLPNIFNRFYRADNSHTVEGTGIGLALVWELTHLHHGTVTVESALGAGSQFTVSFSIDRSAYTTEEIIDLPPTPMENETYGFVKPSSGSRPSLPDNATDGRPIVVVVEDNAELRSYIRGFLGSDYAVHEAENGKAGLERAFDTIPDIVISDVMMPEMDGIQMCRILKEDVRTSHVPVILLTARADSDSKIEGLEIGADDYVTKPFDAKELLARVKNVIEQRNQLRKKFSSGVVLKPGEVSVSSIDDILLKNIMDCVERNIGDENFGVLELSREVCLSRAQLNRKLQALTNLAPSEFIQYIRLQRGKELLERKAGTVAEIAYQVGFKSPSYFGACFRQRFGVTPSAVHRSTPRSAS